MPLVQKVHPHRELNPQKEYRERMYKGVVRTHTGNNAGKCRKCWSMVMGTVTLVQKGHLCQELNPCKEDKKCWYVVVGTKPLVQKGHPHWECRQCRYMAVIGPM